MGPPAWQPPACSQSVHNNATLSPGDPAGRSQFSPAEKDPKFLLSALAPWPAHGRQPPAPPRGSARRFSCCFCRRLFLCDNAHFKEIKMIKATHHQSPRKRIVCSHGRVFGSPRIWCACRPCARKGWRPARGPAGSPGTWSMGHMQGAPKAGAQHVLQLGWTAVRLRQHQEDGGRECASGLRGINVSSTLPCGVTRTMERGARGAQPPRGHRAPSCS